MIRPRLMMESKVDEPFAARPYQVEILDSAKKRNTIVCLGTGTGKTFISLMLIKDKQGQIKGKLEDGGKRTFFLVNTVPLVEQQSKVIIKHSCLKVGHYTGDMGVDFWDVNMWKKEFNKNDVFVMTAQILLNILTHGFFELRNINLLILDECHNASGGHPYSQILQMFRVFELQELPHVMGLTASIINEKYRKSNDEEQIKSFLEKKMKDLEIRMRSVCLTCSDVEATSKYAAKPTESVQPYKSGYDVNEFYEIENMIKETIKHLREKVDLYNQKKKITKVGKSKTTNSNRLQKLLEDKEILKTRDACEVAADATKYVADILEDLGPLCAYNATVILLVQLEKHKKSRFKQADVAVLTDCSKELQTFISTFKRIVSGSSFGVVDNIIPMEPFVTKKAHVFLTDVLLKEKRNFQEKFGTDLHAIVFVQRRCTAVILSKLINLQVQADFETFNGIYSEYVLGHGLDANVRLADSFMKSSKQNKILDQFRNREFNVLVSTSVVEEGLDVQKCNLVVRFDGINNYREYAQSKGRARAKESKFIVMAETEKSHQMERDLKVMQSIENILFEKCQGREGPSVKDMDELYDEIELYYIPTYYGPKGVAGPQINHASAIGLLYRYCNLLPHDEYSRTDPIFRRHDKGNLIDDREYQMECILPLNCPLQNGIYKSSWMPSEDIAKRDVCMKICMDLHKYGELDDDHLLPVKHLDVDSDAEEDEEGAGGSVQEGTKKKRAFYRRKVGRPLVQEGHFDINACDLYAISLTLSDPYERSSSYTHWGLWYDEEAAGFGIFLPKGLPEIRSFVVYAKAGGITVDFIKWNAGVIGSQKLLERFHQEIFNECCTGHVLGDLVFDVNSSQVSKGLLVPLKPSVFKQIQNGKRIAIHDPIDTEKILSVTNADDQYINQSRSGLKNSIVNTVIQKNYGEDNQRKRLYYVVEKSNKKCGDLMESSSKTFMQYYAERYSKSVPPDSPLFDVVLASMKISYTSDKPNKVTKRQAHKELLVSELCEEASVVPTDLHLRMQLLPYALYMMECMVSTHSFKCYIANALSIPVLMHGQEASLVQRKQEGITSVIQSLHKTSCISPTTDQLLQCLTTRQARFGFDLERLEMLGDSFLKQAITIHLFYKYPNAHEGKLSGKRKQNISNRNLFRIAKKIGLPEIICNSQFGCSNPDSHCQNSLTAWLPPGYTRSMTNESPSIGCGEGLKTAGDDLVKFPYQEVQDKSLADSVEALIGAYFQSGGMKLALQFMQNILTLDVLYASISEKDKCQVLSNTKSSYVDYPLYRPLIGASTAQEFYESGKLARFEEKLCYEGRLSHYVFRDKSHLVRAMTHLSYSSEVGIRGSYQEYEFLGDAILDFLVTLHIFHKKVDFSPGEMTSLRSALVNNNTFALLAIQHDFHKFLFQLSPSLFHAIDELVKLVTDDDGKILESCFESPFIIIPEGSDCGYNAPKVLGDIFESIAGAIFLDSGLELVEVWKIYHPIMEPIIEKYMAKIPLQPARELQEKFSNVTLEFTTFDNEVCCVVKRPGYADVSGRGQNNKIAKAAAAKKALEAS